MSTVGHSVETLSGNACMLGHWYVVRWSTIQRSDVDILIRTLGEMKQRLGRPITYLAIQDDAYVEPSSEAKKYAMEKFAEIAALIKFDYLVITSTGVRASLQRTIIKALLALANGARVKHVSKVVVVGSVEEVLKREAGDLPASPVRITEMLRGQGVLAS